jgi:hypothetical protein
MPTVDQLAKGLRFATPEDHRYNGTLVVARANNELLARICPKDTLGWHRDLRECCGR